MSGTSRILRSGQVGPFSSEALALFARFTTPPTYARSVLINNLINSLIVSGVWRQLDALYVMAAADSQAARLNWKADFFNLTAVSSPTFTADRGYAGDGVASYLDTGYTLSTSNGRYTQNVASMGFYINTDAAQNVSDMGTPTAYASIGARNSGSFMTARSNLNAASTAFAGASTAIGDRAWVRNNSANFESYLNSGTSAGTTVGASGALIAETMRLLRGAGTFSTKRMAIGWFGAFPPSSYAALRSANLVYLTAIGAQ